MKSVLIAIITSVTLNCIANTRYVTPLAAGLADGSSWANASADLQGMIDSSAAGDSLWVAAGTFLPSTDIYDSAAPLDNRSKTFLITSGIRMFGGFAGNETSLAQRTLAVMNANPTILSGDLGVPGDTSGNCYHVVVIDQCDSSTVLDGFTVAHGYANGAAAQFLYNQPIYQVWGAGIAVISSPVTLRNIIFTDNHTASLGGGMFSTLSSLTISDCIFAYTSSIDQGGGWDNQFASVSSISNCVFYGNKATSGGGILSEIHAVLYVTNCVFNHNTASLQGGGLSADSSTLKNCIVFGNTPGPVYTRATYSDIEGPVIAPGAGNINNDPRFINASLPAGADSMWRTADDGLRVLPCSPAVDMGTDTGAPAQDILGNNRYDVPGVGISVTDMGAYENLDNRTLAAFAVTGDTLTADSSGRGYQWLVCPALTAASGLSGGQTYIAPANGQYALLITDGACTDTSVCVQVGPTGLNTLAGGVNGMVLYPNPANNYLHIELPGGDNTAIAVYDVLGAIRYPARAIAGAPLDISNLPAGTYFLQAGEQMARFIVIR